MFKENGKTVREDKDIAEAFKERQESIFQPNISSDTIEDKRRKLWYEHKQFHNRTTYEPYDHIFGTPPNTYPNTGTSSNLYRIFSNVKTRKTKCMLCLLILKKPLTK